ncbi:unnamed protein product [Effrenium voratum]|nr:unnamed protein product [Effrenium voratum]
MATTKRKRNLSNFGEGRAPEDHMKTVGEVVYADLFTEGGRSRGCALVSFKSREDARRAVVELNDTDLGGRTIIVREDRVDQSSGPQDCRVYVGNLSWQATWKDLKDHCRAVGEAGPKHEALRLPVRLFALSSAT